MKKKEKEKVKKVALTEAKIKIVFSQLDEKAGLNCN